MAKPEVSPPDTAARLTRASPIRRLRTSPKPAPIRALISTGSPPEAASLARNRETASSPGPRGRHERRSPARERSARSLNRGVDLGSPAPIVEACFGGQTDEIEAVRLRPF